MRITSKHFWDHFRQAKVLGRLLKSGNRDVTSARRRAPGNSKGGFQSAAMTLESRLLLDGTALASQFRAEESQAATEVVFIENNIANYEQLVAALSASSEVHVVDQSGDGLQQIAAILDGRHNISALHIISHGSQAALSLGTLELTAQNLDANVIELAAIGNALALDSDILLYGCNVGAGKEGIEWLERLAVLTGADIAASEDYTGDANLAGDWDLESQVGAIETVSVGQQVPINYEGILPQPAYSSADGYIGETFFTILFNIPLDETNPPSLSAFEVQINGTDVTVTGRTVNGAKNSVVVSVNATLLPGDIIDFVYTDPTISNDSNAIQGLDGTDAASFSHSLIVAITRPGPSAPATPTLDAGSDGGQAGDRITNDNTPTFSGTADANATVKLYDTDGTTLLGTTTANSLGSWSITSSTLSNGSHSVSVTQTDSNNSTSPLSGKLTVTIDTVANAPANLAVAASSDSGTVGDRISNVGNPVISGTGESGASVTLFDSDGVTILGSATVSGASKWSLTSGALAQGTHMLTAKQTDVAGNTSNASSSLTYILDTIGPTNLQLSPASVAQENAGNGATVSTLFSTDTTSVTYGFAVGNGIIDADNGKFTVSGTSLVAAQSLTAGSYHIYMSATDAAGNIAFQIFTLSVTNNPTVNSITREGASLLPSFVSEADFRVTFSESVTGVDISDFSVTTTGTASGAVSAVSETGAGDYVVTVNNLSGDGTIRLDLKSSGTGIKNGSHADILGGFTSGETYLLDHTAPATPNISGLTTGTDTGASRTDGITGNVTPTVTGVSDANVSITLYDTDGSTVIGTATSDGSGKWSVATSALSDGLHLVTAKASDSAGNISTSSSSLSVQIVTATPRVTTVTQTSGNRAYKAGETVTIKVGLTQSVVVDDLEGTPSLKLETGSTDRFANYVSGSGSENLIFAYVVQPGDSSSDLQYFDTSNTSTSLSLNWAEIYSFANGLSADLTLPSGNSGSSLGETSNIVIDTEAPSVLVSPNGGISMAGTITFTFQFSETVTGFTAGDISVTNGTKGTFTAIDGDTYTLQLIPTADGTVSASVETNAAQDAATNGNTSGSGFIVSDTTRPKLAISPAFAYSKESAFILTFQFSEEVTGFAKSDVVVTNGVARLFTAVDGETYTLNITPSGDGDVGISVGTSAGRDAAGNGTTSATATIRSDRTLPVATIGAPSRTKTQLGPITFPITYADTYFDKSTLSLSDVTLNATGTATGTLSVDTGTGTSRTVTISNISGVGTLGISLATGTARDKAGNLAASAGPSATVQVQLGITVTRDRSGNLVINDTKTTDLNDALTITADNGAAAFVIYEPTALVSTNVPGASTIDEHTVSVPYARVTGPSVTINPNLGDDSVRLVGANTGAAVTKNYIVTMGAGRDTATLEASLISRFTGAVSIDGGSEDDVLTAELITGNGAFPVTLTGAGGNDTLMGGDGNDFIRGGAGEDVLIGGPGNDNLGGQGGVDQLTGGAGDDSLDGGTSDDRVVEAGNVDFTLTNTSLLGLGTDTLTSIEAATLDGGVSANKLDASAFTFSAILRGNAGNDSLIGGSGNDVLRGGGGDDELTGGLGDDCSIGNSGIDTVIESGDVNFGVSVTTPTDPALPVTTVLNGLGNDSLEGIEQLKLTGGASANQFDVSAFSGRVTLDGGAGNDSLIGGSISDILIGGDGDDSLTGNGGNDSLIGGAGNDVLFGNLGRDTLEGGGNNDTLDGGAGHVDVIRYDVLDTVIADIGDQLTLI